MECTVIYGEKHIPIHVEKQKQNPTGAKRNTCLKEVFLFLRKLSEVSAVDAWFIFAPPMKASKKPTMKHE
jgi:hypothetical protein